MGTPPYSFSLTPSSPFPFQLDCEELATYYRRKGDEANAALWTERLLKREPANVQALRHVLRRTAASKS